MKTCSKCKISKPLNAFRKSAPNLGGFKSWCRDCEKSYRLQHYKETREVQLRRTKEWQRNNRELYLRLKRESVLKTQYGIDSKTWDKLYKKQGKGCAICGREKDGKSRRLAVDHCHKTNRVRGLLCSQCNQGLGKFRDNPELLRKAISYLIS